MSENRSWAKRAFLSVVVGFVILAAGVALRAQGKPGQVDPGNPFNQILAKLDQLAGLLPQTKTTTKLLFPFASSIAGFDTAIALDNFGTTAGSCVVSFFGTGAPSDLPVSIAAGGQYVNVLSTIAPGFQGFIKVNCNFPTARGWGFFSDAGAREVAASIEAEVLP